MLLLFLLCFSCLLICHANHLKSSVHEEKYFLFHTYVELHFMGLVKMDDRSEMLTYVNVKSLKE